MIDRSIIINLISMIAVNVNPDKIYLFGSYATGQANENNDIDLLVISYLPKQSQLKNEPNLFILLKLRLPCQFFLLYTFTFI